MTSAVTLLAFDFDGTLAPIHDDPAKARIDEAALEFLEEASTVRGLVVAVISGRDAADVAARTNASGAFIVGSHGLEIRAPGGSVIRDSPPLTVQPDGVLRARVEASGLRLERKKHGIALHWRGVPHIDGTHPIVTAFRNWAKGEGLHVVEGRCAVEARLHGSGKEEALRWLATTSAASRVIYSGDDMTDFGPLQFAAERGRALFIASDERTPPPGVTVVESLEKLLPLLRDEVLL
jgi:trehalose 6-phosphate phosphatase